MFTHYKNDAIRKLVIGFGTLFNNIKIVRYRKNGTTTEHLIPLSYAPKEKFIKRLINPSSISDRTRVEIDVPQMAFEITDILYDPNRKMNKIFDHHGSGPEGQTLSSKMEVPYNFIFGLYVYSRNIDENLEIMEQILPTFSPEFVISLNVTDIHKKIDVPISLNKTILTQEYEGDFSTRRMVVSTFQFTAKYYVYNRVKSSDVIREFDLSAFNEFDDTQIDII